MMTLTVRFFELSWPHAGLLIVPASRPSQRLPAVVAALLEYDRRHPEGISACTVDFLHPSRV